MTVDHGAALHRVLCNNENALLGAFLQVLSESPRHSIGWSTCRAVRQIETVREHLGLGYYLAILAMDTYSFVMPHSPELHVMMLMDQLGAKFDPRVCIQLLQIPADPRDRARAYRRLLSAISDPSPPPELNGIAKWIMWYAADKVGSSVHSIAAVTPRHC